ncbi:MAG: hypothetical protein IH627_12745 [Rubrivivax sp.]|nr:hypothetical protein [Rubrivivax sp.]
MSSLRATPTPYETTVHELDLSFNVTVLRDKPTELAGLLGERIKLAAKYLGRTVTIQHSAALEAVAQAVRFQSWHQLSSHLSRATTAGDDGRLPASWPDALSGALLLLADVEREIAMPEAQLQAYERFAETLAMLTDTSAQVVLDGVCASLCAGKSWAEVRARNPLKATSALYAFVVEEPEVLYDDDEEDDEGHRGPAGGYFDESRACSALIEELDEQWQGYDSFTKVQKRQARIWVERALAAQPGFLEAGLALASMQHEAGQPEAAATLDRFIKQAEALIPDGFKGLVPWVQLGNRFYHRMLWLRLQLHFEANDLKGAARLARKQLRLNPGDNLGVRFVLPLLLLQQGDYVTAKRATKGLRGEDGLSAGAIRAFCEFAVGNKAAFRRELAEALISLPWLRVFLMSQRAHLPDGDDGIRGIHPDLELFTQFVWPAYVEVPGLVHACRSFLSEPRVLAAEAGLRRYWKGYWGRGADRVGSSAEWRALCGEALDAIGKP